MGAKVPRIAIVGAGFTGTMLAVQLLRKLAGPAKITLFDRRGAFGRGLAYSARNPRHVLNVRVTNMSAFDEDAQHFIRWLWANDSVRGGAAGVPPSGHAFVSRATFGAYVEDVLRAAIAEAGPRARVAQRVADAVGIAIAPGGARLALADGASVEADRVALCVGNFPPATPAPIAPAVAESGRFVADPWDEEAIDRIRSDDTVLVIGTGLTMVDMVVDLLARGFQGPIHALSRRGLLPQAHELTRTYPPFLDRERLPRGLLALTRRIRREVRDAASRGQDWRSVMDAIRPLVQDLWIALDEDDRRRFLRHLRPYWDVHRHRMAPEIAREIERLRAEGRLSTHAGRIASSGIEGGRIKFTFRPRAGGAERGLVGDWVINCAGPETDYARIRHPLVSSLLASGLARPDPLALGLDLTPSFQLIGREGRPTPRLYALGPPTRGLLWESTAVPDIRKQCAQFSARLAAELA